MRIDIVTLFPGMFQGPFRDSILKRAQARGLVRIAVHNLRDFASGRHRITDERPYGGGAGMVLKAEPVYQALRALGARPTVRAVGRARLQAVRPSPWCVYLSPQGRILTQATAERLTTQRWLILLCGHYEGLDERMLAFVDEELSIGDYVLTGGELPAMVLADAVARLLPGVVKEPASVAQDSFRGGLRLDYPQYTRPENWRGVKVPNVLLSGHHAQIARWRQATALLATRDKRPDLLERQPMTPQERRLLQGVSLR
ncbi:MAG: tRNA (guanosine(37)-N1)-methyltransferase TrmD [Elusimicrobia bacterium]|nr:tRNA (guanosine(37)-N1)-methyltransferase TrmD [Elusimicrobiota bacterium]